MIIFVIKYFLFEKFKDIHIQKFDYLLLSNSNKDQHQQ